MRSLAHQCEAFAVDHVMGEVRVRCACGWALRRRYPVQDAVNDYVTHVIAQFAIERPPADVIEDARRAFESRKRG